MPVPPPTSPTSSWARTSVPTQPVPTSPQDSVPQDAPYAPIVSAAAPTEPSRWSAKRTAGVGAIALALFSAGAVTAAALTPDGIAGPAGRDGRFGPGGSQTRQFGPGGPGQGAGPGQQGQQLPPGQGTGPQQRGQR